MQSPFHSSNSSLRKASRIITALVVGFSLLIGSTLTVGAKTGEIRKSIVEPVQAIFDLSTENTLREEDKIHETERTITLRKKQLADERAEIEASKSAELEAQKKTQVIRKTVINKTTQTQNAPIHPSPQNNPGTPSLPEMDYNPPAWFVESSAKSQAEFEAKAAASHAEFEANAAKSKADFEAAKAAMLGD